MYQRMSAAEREGDHDFNTVSRRHLSIAIENGEAVLEDLSSNGTFCNDRLLQGPTRVVLSAEGHSLRLGTRETLILSLTASDDPRIQGLAPVKTGGMDAPAAVPSSVVNSH
jgi:pSer/pThr/pTyr-binding forkhead associated (FHA) protein